MSDQDEATQPPLGKHFEEEKGSGSAPVPMFSQEPLDQSDILGAHFPALYDHRPRSAEKYFLCLSCARGRISLW
jgi:hypothetical protein